MMKILVGFGGNPNATDTEKWTPLVSLCVLVNPYFVDIDIIIFYLLTSDLYEDMKFKFFILSMLPLLVVIYIWSNS